MSEKPSRWVTDTVCFSHLARAGHLEILERLSPQGLLLVPSYVGTEIINAQQNYQGVPNPYSLSWVDLAVLTPEEDWTFLEVKAGMGGDLDEHLGECAAIAVAKHRDGLVLLDDQAAGTQAKRQKVPFEGTLWVVMEAWYCLYDKDWAPVIAVVDALIATGMRLPISSGEELVHHAYEQGWLPREDRDEDEEPEDLESA